MFSFFPLTFSHIIIRKTYSYYLVTLILYLSCPHILLFLVPLYLSTTVQPWRRQCLYCPSQHPAVTGSAGASRTRWLSSLRRRRSPPSLHRARGHQQSTPCPWVLCWTSLTPLRHARPWQVRRWRSGQHLCYATLKPLFFLWLMVLPFLWYTNANMQYLQRYGWFWLLYTITVTRLTPLHSRRQSRKRFRKERRQYCDHG